ncbi:MAG: reverse transcriptase domain-containing protein [Acidimicrobiales bacterium]
MRKPSSSRPIIEQISSDRFLWAAWARVAAGSGMPGVDGVTLERYASHLSDNLGQLAGLLRQGYHPQPLRPAISHRGAKPRALAIPTVRDRVAQRSFLEVVGPRLDAEAAEASFAYRRGRSWLDALAKTERSRDQGLRWVYRGDIEAFFESIDHETLRQALTSRFADPAATELVMGWVTAPLLSDNGLQERRRGVPTGAPISPALANLYLAAFDRMVDGRFGRLIRYADDMAVLCADEDGALRAQHLVESTLAAIRLRVQPAKSYVSNFDRGFSFLGWVFFRDAGFEESASSSRWVHPMSVGRGRR